jgi:Protein of unknown function (DUF3631)
VGAVIQPQPCPEPAAEALLRDLRALFRGRGVDRLATAEIVAALGARLGRPLTAHRLARMLKPHGVAPRQFRMPGSGPCVRTRSSGRRAWGYRLHDLAERRDAAPPVESRDADRLDAEQEWASRVAMMHRHRGGME